MKLFSALIVFASLSAPSAFAAKFELATKAKNASVRELVKTAKGIIKNERVFGDASRVNVYDYTRSDSQTDLNTVRQLNHMKAGLNSDDDAGTLEKNSAAKLADWMFENSVDDDGSLIDDAKREMADALKAIKADRSLQLYSTAHGDEDGTWTVLNILDTENSQVVLIMIGYSGT